MLRRHRFRCGNHPGKRHLFSRHRFFIESGYERGEDDYTKGMSVGNILDVLSWRWLFGWLSTDCPTSRLPEPLLLSHQC